MGTGTQTTPQVMFVVFFLGGDLGGVFSTREKAKTWISKQYRSELYRIDAVLLDEAL